MPFPISNRALLRGMIAGAVVLAACSRSDRNKSAPDNAAAVATDTASTAAAQPGGTGTVADTGTTNRAVSDTASTAAPSNEAAGYREMGRDTASTPSEPVPARVTADPSETSLGPADSASVDTASAAPVTDTASTDAAAVSDTTSTTVAVDASAAGADSTRAADDGTVADTSATEVAVASDTAGAGYAEMARDTTSATPEQADTAAQAEGDVALQASVDTAHADAEVAAEAPVTSDTLVAAADTSTTVASADTLDSERVRPPEDSTEILGNAASEARTDEVGAAAIGGNVTGAEAVSLMTRQGAECLVVDPESNEAVRWDMSSTPATLNPCGMGSMNLSKIWTAGSR